jgi:outer membrane protein assembly factor BamE (lipoprotein component of BamABCDE complex)
MKMRPVWLCALALGTALFLSGCVSTGVRVSEDEARAFVVGQSTYAEVTAKLGQPTTSTLNSDGTRVAVYAYTAVQERPENFIPYIGGLVGGADTKSNDVTFTFDKNGILLSTTSSQSQAGIGTNLSAGTPIKRSAPQR